MSIGPRPDPRATALADIVRKISEFFGTGGQVTSAPGFERPTPPTRSNKIDPDTILKRRRPSPTQAERIALRRITERL
ncbi:hypothetical protein [Pseudomonas iridis]|uniref:hypothetical protein n=1 Tax=Pseudomonas iridis TaxID=2710587 RepID=UPI001B3350F4|nr:hypothetical protein [Pseudomonas iridis]MBP5969920.1 hypothetical protein [Pseudomonas iridis]